MKQNFNTRLLPKALTVTVGDTKVGKTLAALAATMAQQEHANKVQETRKNYEVFDRYKAVVGI
jgi:hypothetical protein